MKYIKLFENFKTQLFYNYNYNFDNSDKGKTGTWGYSERHNDNKGKETIFSFNDNDNVFTIDSSFFYPVVSEAIWNKKIPKTKQMTDESEKFDWHFTHMDYIVSLYLKKNGYDGVIYSSDGEEDIATDLRDFTIKELEYNFQYWKDNFELFEN